MSFFPYSLLAQLRKKHTLLPQSSKGRHFDYMIAVNGLKQILWGLFIKVVIADTCATYE
jgi:alginate O-acetyltransferase complex protein AlgI